MAIIINDGANTIIMEIIHKEKLNNTLNIIDVKKGIHNTIWTEARHSLSLRRFKPLVG